MGAREVNMSSKSSRGSIGVVVVSIALGVGAPAGHADNYNVTGHGCFTCVDESGAAFNAALAGVVVHLMDSDAEGSHLFDDDMGWHKAANTGCFTIPGS